MIVRSVDSDNDWNFGKGKNDYKRDKDALAQVIKTTLQNFLGDCFFAVSDGMDWWNLLGSKRREELELNVATTILNIPEVTELIEVSSVLDENRAIRLQYSCNSIYGVITDSVIQET